MTEIISMLLLSVLCSPGQLRPRCSGGSSSVSTALRTHLMIMVQFTDELSTRDVRKALKVMQQ